MPRGPLIGRILDEVHAAVLDGVIATPQQEEEYAQQIIAREGHGTHERIQTRNRYRGSRCKWAIARS